MKSDWGYYGTYDESAHADLWDGVVGYWAPCLGPTGLRLHDVSRSVNWGTLTNMDAATDWVVDAGQYALDFDGTNDTVRVESASPLERSFLTVAAWISPASFPSAYNTVICKNEDTTRYCTILVKSNGKMAYYVYASGNISIDGSGPTTLSAGTWYFVAMSYSAVTGLRTYVNTTSQGTVAGNGPQTTGSTFMQIGSHDQALTGGTSGRYFSGRIDNVCSWNRILTDAELRRVYELGRGGLLQRKPRRRIQSIQPVAFRAHYATQRAQLIGGGLR
jgi:hypothetical protein